MDIFVDESLIIIIRYFNSGNVQDRILNLIKVSDCIAEGIFKDLKQELDSNNIPYNNIIGFGSDGASTMMGQHTGAQARI